MILCSFLSNRPSRRSQNFGHVLMIAWSVATAALLWKTVFRLDEITIFTKLAMLKIKISSTNTCKNDNEKTIQIVAGKNSPGHCPIGVVRSLACVLVLLFCCFPPTPQRPKMASGPPLTGGKCFWNFAFLCFQILVGKIERFGVVWGRIWPPNME